MPVGDLEYRSKALKGERASKFKGYVKVPTCSLVFFPDCTPSDQNVSRKKVNHMKRIMKREGCDRLNPRHVIVGDIDAAALAAALGHCMPPLDKIPGASEPFMLHLPQGVFIRCAQGRSRVRALEEMRDVDRWWVIELYVDLSHDAFKIINDDFESERNFTDGYIYSKICHYRLSDRVSEKQWWARLSPSKGKILKRLLKHQNLAPYFSRVLLEIPGMQDALQIGSLSEMLAGKSDEEIVHYLDLIYCTWLFIMGSKSELSFVNAKAVKEFELRVPGLSQIDDDYVTQAIEDSEVFEGLTDSEPRKQILDRARRIPYLIPSIYTLHEDFKYWRRCTEVLKQLLGPNQPRYTVEKHARGAFELDMNLFKPHLRHIYLHIIQNHSELSGENPLMEDDEGKPEPRNRDLRAWYGLAKRAAELGFTSDEIDRNLLCNPDREVAKRALFDARPPPDFEYDPSRLESLITHITKAFEEAVDRPPAGPTPSLTCNVGGEPIRRRCGRHYSGAYVRDRRFLTDHIFSQKVHKSTDITSLFVRRSVFNAFLGGIDNMLDIDHDHNPIDPTHDEQETQNSAENMDAEVGPDPHVLDTIRHDLPRQDLVEPMDAEIGPAPHVSYTTHHDVLMQHPIEPASSDQSPSISLQPRNLEHQQHQLTTGETGQQIAPVIAASNEVVRLVDSDISYRPTSTLTKFIPDTQGSTTENRNIRLYIGEQGQWPVEPVKHSRQSLPGVVSEIMGRNTNLRLFTEKGHGIQVDDLNTLNDTVFCLAPEGARFPPEEEL